MIRINNLSGGSGGSGGSETNEVKEFVGEIPSGWEEITYQPQTFPEFNLTFDSFNINNFTKNIKRNPINNKLYSDTPADSANLIIRLMNEDLTVANTISVTNRRTGGDFDFTDDGLGIVRIGANTSDNFVDFIDISNDLSFVHTAKANFPANLVSRSQFINATQFSVRNIGDDVFVYTAYDTTKNNHVIFKYDLDTNTHTFVADIIDAAYYTNTMMMQKIDSDNVLVYGFITALTGGSFINDAYVVEISTGTVTKLTTGLDDSVLTLSSQSQFIPNYYANGNSIDLGNEIMFLFGYSVVYFDKTTQEFSYLTFNIVEHNQITLKANVPNVLISDEFGYKLFNTTNDLNGSGPIFRLFDDYNTYRQSQIFKARKL